MKKINCPLANGDITEVEVSDNVAELTAGFDVADKRTRWRDYKRAELSLNALEEKGYEPPDTTVNIAIIAEKNVDKATLHKAIATLSTDQQRLVRQVFFEEVSLQDIAVAERRYIPGDSEQAKKNIEQAEIFFALGGCIPTLPFLIGEEDTRKCGLNEKMICLRLSKTVA